MIIINSSPIGVFPSLSNTLNTEVSESIFDFFNTISNSCQIEILFENLFVYYILYQKIQNKDNNNSSFISSDFEKQTKFLNDNFKTDIVKFEVNDYFKIFTL